jgi:GLPGLI family protein
MKHITFTICFLALHSLVFAQKNCVIFFQTYEVTDGVQDTIVGHYPEMLVINDSVSYSRPFDNDKKIKFKNGEVGNDFQSHAAYYNFSTKKIVRQSHLAGKFKRIIYDTVKFYKWEILDSTKYILGYKCTLATLSIGDWEYEAWFTKDLPPYHSTLSYTGLLGTTLEYSYHRKKLNGSVFVKPVKIENTTIKVVEPTQGKVISDKEAREILEESQRVYIDIH